MNSVRGTIVFVLIFLIIWFGYWVHEQIARPVSIEMQVDRPLQCYAGETIRVEAVAINQSLLASGLLSVEPACGCTSLENQSLKRIAAKASVPMNFVVDTTGKLGNIDFGGHLQSVNAFGRVFERDFSIPIEVVQPWFSTATRYFWPAEKESLTVEGSFFIFENKLNKSVSIPKPMIYGGGKLRIDVDEEIKKSDIIEFNSIVEPETGRDTKFRLRARVSFVWVIDPIGELASARVVFRPVERNASGITVSFLTAKTPPVIQISPSNATIICGEYQGTLRHQFQVFSTEIPIQSVTCDSSPQGIVIESIRQIDAGQWTFECYVPPDFSPGKVSFELRANGAIPVPVTINLVSQ